MMEVGCPNCGNRYRLPAPPLRNPAFHCLACDTRFSIHTAPVVDPPTAAPRTESAAIIPGEEAPTSVATAPLATPPVRLWPWLMALLLIVAAIGGWLNRQAWAHAPLLQSLEAWWAPQRSIGWGITATEPQWITRRDAPPLLAIGLQLHNKVMFDRPPPPLLLITHRRGARKPGDAQLVTLHHQPSLTQLEQPDWHPPEADRTPIAAGGERDYTVVLDHPPDLLESVELTLN